MLQLETSKKYLTNATWLKHVDFTIMHRDRHTTRQIIKPQRLLQVSYKETHKADM
jgi:hypothetical protein